MVWRKDPVVGVADNLRSKKNVEMKAGSCSAKSGVVLDRCRCQVEGIKKIVSYCVGELGKKDGCVVSCGIAIWYCNDGADADVAVTFPLDTVADGRVAGGVLPRKIWAGNTVRGIVVVVC